MFVNENTYKEYEMESRNLTKEEAAELAREEYRNELYDVLGDGKIISKDVVEEFDGVTYKVHCSLYCLADIGKKVPLVISDKSENNHMETETKNNGTENS